MVISNLFNSLKSAVFAIDKDLNGKKDNKIKALPSTNEKKKKQVVGRILWVRKKRRKSN